MAARRALVHVAAGAAVSVELEAGGTAALVGAQRVETLVLARTGILTQVALDCTGCPVCLVLKQGAVNQLFLEVFLIFLACLDHARWAQFHLGILGPQE